MAFMRINEVNPLLVAGLNTFQAILTANALGKKEKAERDIQRQDALFGGLGKGFGEGFGGFIQNEIGNAQELEQQGRLLQQKNDLGFNVGQNQIDLANTRAFNNIRQDYIQRRQELEPRIATLSPEAQKSFAERDRAIESFIKDPSFFPNGRPTQSAIQGYGQLVRQQVDALESAPPAMTPAEKFQQSVFPNPINGNLSQFDPKSGMFVPYEEKSSEQLAATMTRDKALSLALKSRPDATTFELNQMADDFISGRTAPQQSDEQFMASMGIQPEPDQQAPSKGLAPQPQTLQVAPSVPPDPSAQQPVHEPTLSDLLQSVQQQQVLQPQPAASSMGLQSQTPQALQVAPSVPLDPSAQQQSVPEVQIESMLQSRGNPVGDARFLFEAFGPDLEGFDGVSDDQKARGIATAIQFSDFVESTWSNPSEVPDVILAMLIRLKKAGMLEPILGGQ